MEEEKITMSQMISQVELWFGVIIVKGMVKIKRIREISRGGKIRMRRIRVTNEKSRWRFSKKIHRKNMIT